MSTKNLEKKLTDMGFPLMEVQKEDDVNQTLAELIQSRDTRYWEGFPVVFAQGNKEGKLSEQDVKKFLKEKSQNEAYQNLARLSLALYKCFPAFYSGHAWIRNLENGLKQKGKEAVEKYEKLLANKENVHIAGQALNASRLVRIFEYYLSDASAQMRRKAEQLEGLSLEHALSQIFSPRQKQLFRKKLDGEPLTKTEKEYFSRVVKKKVLALANPELHRLARKLLE